MILLLDINYDHIDTERLSRKGLSKLEIIHHVEGASYSEWNTGVVSGVLYYRCSWITSFDRRVEVLIKYAESLGQLVVYQVRIK